jgi:hypothetical protein
MRRPQATAGKLTTVLAILFAAGVWAAPARAALPSDILDSLYRTELGDKFSPDRLPQFHAAHDLLEQYFAADSAEQRGAIVRQIDAIGLDTPTIGRLARLRMNWPQLTPGVYFINEKAGPYDVKYFLGVPRRYNVSQSWPLVVKLPVANAFVTNPTPDADRVVQIYTQWIDQELLDHPDALVLMPLLNLDHFYGPGVIGMNLVMQPILNAASKANIDPARVYLTGHSMAAHAVWNIALHYPTYFAAINPLAGSANEDWQRVRLGNLRNTLVIMWHDVTDDVIDVEDSRSLWRYLVRMKYDVAYDETQNIGHVPTAAIVEDQYQKMRKRIRPLYPRQVFIQSSRTETIYNRNDWVQIYQAKDMGMAKKILFARGGGGLTDYQNDFRVLAKLADANTIDLDLRNVRSLRLYLNDQMVDLSKPLTVTVSGKTVFHGMLNPSIDEMLKDQLFLGRGWRYYTAVLDLDFGDKSPTRPSVPPNKRGTIDFTAPNGQQQTWSATQNSKSN